MIICLHSAQPKPLTSCTARHAGACLSIAIGACTQPSLLKGYATPSRSHDQCSTLLSNYTWIRSKQCSARPLLALTCQGSTGRILISCVVGTWCSACQCGLVHRIVPVIRTVSLALSRRMCDRVTPYYVRSACSGRTWCSRGTRRWRKR
jgi:hypothetical protein